ncbi:BNR-4 repeat-containing protein [Klebsiella grimontii]|uniref:BNR-4 repeat-containing protein n=1 Tax=Klebsiella grimontii TaxID=2058152 RepID=UPI00310142EF
MAELQISQISDIAAESNQAGWWHPVEAFSGSEYYVLCAVSDTAGYHKVVVVKRNPDGSLESGECKNSDGSTEKYIDDIGHNQPSIVVDGAGYVHVFTSMHNDLLRYFRSTRPGDVSELVNATWDFPDVEWPWTYPIVGRAPDGDIYAMLRGSNRYSTGETRRPSFLYKYDLATGVWSRFAHVAENEDRAVYPDDMHVNASGIHFIFEWSAFPAAAVRHVGEYAIIGLDGWLRNIAGTPFPMPSAQGQLAYRPLKPGEVPGSGSGYTIGIQTAKFAFARDETLGFITYRFRDAAYDQGDSFSKFNVKVATWNGTAWSEEEIAAVPPEFGNTSAALAATMNGTEKRVYFSVEYASSGDTVAVIVLATNAGSGWQYSVLGPANPTLLRLGSAPAANGGDVIYVSSPYAGKVSRYYVPADYEPDIIYTQFSDLITSLELSGG